MTETRAGPGDSARFTRLLLLTGSLIALGFAAYYAIGDGQQILMWLALAIGLLLALCFQLCLVGYAHAALHLAGAVVTCGMLLGIHLQMEAMVWMPYACLSMFVLMRWQALPWTLSMLFATLLMALFDPRVSSYPPNMLIGALLSQLTGIIVFVLALRQQDQMRKVRMQLVQREAEQRRMRTLNDISAGIAHLINNSMQVVHGGAFLLRDHLQTPEGLTLLRDIEGKAEETCGLARKLLYCARNMTPEWQTKDLAALIRDWFANERTQAMPRTRLRLPQRPVVCRLDVTLMHEVLRELWNNAREAGAHNIEISLTADGAQGCLIQVRDDGHGFDTAKLEQAFDPFYSTRFLGRGLGLPAARGIVELHDGTISIENNETQGCTVTLSLPRINDVQGQQEDPQNEHSGA
ncbi:MAG: sensor histidine kinase [Zetaproteobacteria bacterium]|nr:MAG: sensor histidine kinase [Zetaproteobacteria bacterium]